MSDSPDECKGIKRKLEEEQKKMHSEKKRKKKDKTRPQHCPLSERQQLALLMQMTAEKNTEQTTPPPSSRKTPGSSGRKDKVNKRNERGETPLHLATIRGDLNTITDLIKQGADINIQDYAGWTPLHEACNHGYHDIAKYLLESGANVNSKGLDNDYPLHDAVINGHVDLVGLLLKHGANPLLPNKQGERPLDLGEDDEISKMMKNEIISSDEEEEKSPVHAAVSRKNTELRTDSESDRSDIITTIKSNKHQVGGASRELFKNVQSTDKEKKSSFNKSNLSSSESDSDIKEKSSHFPSKSLSLDISSSQEKMKKNKNHRSLFSSTTESSSDCDNIKQSGHGPHNVRKLSYSSDESKTASTPFVSSKTSGEKQKPILNVSAAKKFQSDVYDFSPSADDFLNTSDSISLKPDSKDKWNRGLTTKTSSGIFSKKPLFPPAKVSLHRKNSKTDHGNTKTAIIKPVSYNATPYKQSFHETTEMMFDRIFKSPTPDDTPASQIASTSLNTTTQSNTTYLSEPKISKPMTSHWGSVLTSTTVTLATSQSKPSGYTSTTPISTHSSSLVPKSAVAITSLPASTPAYSTASVKSDVKPKRRSTDAEQVDNISGKNLTLSASTDNQNPKTSEIISENKSVAKVMKMDISKEKLFKTVSDPAKKPVVKSTTSDIKKTAAITLKSITVKKEAKIEQKRLSLSSDSNFLSDIETVSRKREQEKNLKRKKLLQKKVKSVTKVEEKKNPKLKLMESEWLGTPTDKTEKLTKHKRMQKSTPKRQDSVDSNLSQLPQMTDLITHMDPSFAVPKPVSIDFAETTTSRRFSSDILHSTASSVTLTPVHNTTMLPRPYIKPSIPVSEMKYIPPVLHDNNSNIIPALNFSALSATAISSEITTPSLQPNAQIQNNSSFAVAEKQTSKPGSTNPVLSMKANTSSPQPIIVEENSSVTSSVVASCSSQPKQENIKEISAHSDTTELVKGNNANEPASEQSEDTVDKEPEPETEISKKQKMLQEYIKEKLATGTISFKPVKKKLPVYIPMEKLLEKEKVSRLNVYDERAAIQKLVFEKRKRFTTVIPQAPQYYWEYMTFTGGYLLNNCQASHLSVPVLAAPPFLCDSMSELFNAHETQRVRLRVQHAIQREKLIISCEQEIMRVHSRAARTTLNQQEPLSACSFFMDNEVYYMPRATNPTDGAPPKASIRDRFNARMFLSWLQDVDDKYDKMKSSLLARQRHEAEAMFAVQKTEWIMKLQELDNGHRTITSDEVNDLHVPMVNIADDFDLLPA